MGASTGLNVSAAVQVARLLGPGNTVVTCLCDTGARYYNKLYSRAELESRGEDIGFCAVFSPPPFSKKKLMSLSVLHRTSCIKFQYILQA